MATAISLSNQRRDHQFGVLIFEMRGIYEKKNQKSGEARERPGRGQSSEFRKTKKSTRI